MLLAWYRRNSHHQVEKAHFKIIYDRKHLRYVTFFTAILNRLAVVYFKSAAVVKFCFMQK